MAHITSLVMEKVQFNHFPIISLWELSVAMATKLRGRRQMFGYFKLSYAKQHLYQIRVLLLQRFLEELSFKKFLSFLNLMLPWQPNKMATGHQTHKLGRQSSYDHNCQIWFTLFQWLWRKCN